MSVARGVSELRGSGARDPEKGTPQGVRTAKSAARGHFLEARPGVVEHAFGSLHAEFFDKPGGRNAFSFMKHARKVAFAHSSKTGQRLYSEWLRKVLCDPLLQLIEATRPRFLSLQ